MSMFPVYSLSMGQTSRVQATLCIMYVHLRRRYNLLLSNDIITIISWPLPGNHSVYRQITGYVMNADDHNSIIVV